MRPEDYDPKNCQGQYYCWLGKISSHVGPLGLTVWPLEPCVYPKSNDTGGAWRIYLNADVHRTIQRANNSGIKWASGKRIIDVCFNCFGFLYEDWQAIMEEEVNLEQAWNAYLDRIDP